MISGAELRDAFISAANNIANYREAVDALNIFPVPDGDTGTNMSNTMASALSVLGEMADDIAVSEVAAKTSSALLRGARGNSGAITSLIFRGFADGLRGCEEANGIVIASALRMASENAYRNIASPTEGTILTVIRLAAEAAENAAGPDVDTVDVFAAAVDGAHKALRRTPELLNILKRAKVVDAGGQGLVHIFDAMLCVFATRTIIPADSGTAEVKTAAANIFAEEEFTHTYCTELLINKQGNGLMHTVMFKSFIEERGDCVVLVEDDDVIKLHVHSDCPGEIITEALSFGELANVKIENMKIQHRNASWGTNADTEESKPEIAEPIKKFGFVAVGAGAGICSAFAELSVDNIVSGGQTMNPSTEDILNAINMTPSETVFVLPNNKNIILTAHQASELTPKKVIVIESRSIPQGISALTAFDEQKSAETNTRKMSEAMAGVQTVSVTFAARDANVNGQNIREGDIMGLENNKVTEVDNDPNTVAARCVKHLAKRSSEEVTIYYGDGMTEEAAFRLAEEIRPKLNDGAEISVVYGGQPVYYYIIGIE